MKEITASGNTVEEAIESALKQLKTEKEQVEVTIIDEGKKGFLGVFGTKPAVVRVKKKQNPELIGKRYLQQITDHLNLAIDISAKTDGKTITFELQGERIAMLIGRRGQTLNALQYLVSLAINKNHTEFYQVVVDAEDYRSRRKETLQQLAQKMADKAVQTNKKIILDPMPSFERKIIHHQLQYRDDVTTESQGEDPHRSVMIKPK